ncbi:putative ABC transport system permease protein [Parafrankia irregularis]|uniref:Putative ABC transport system permease protein n=1 Tax=Parafrankia irregularis TaxID=795642 RepID=A0A0S4QE47_9ACTN|nr:ABC transporter permease [Parafrankia irregularis]CUU53851.1 putative ABC transport system permease protein [Parafrankia irregularis]
MGVGSTGERSAANRSAAVGSVALWLRWSWRDLRQRWLLVLALAVTIGLGTGLYAGLSSSSQWRRQSYDASFAQLHVHDLRAHLNAGSTVEQGRLAGLVRSLPSAPDVAGVVERLIFPAEVEVTAGDRDVLARGEVVGSDLTASPPVDSVAVEVGHGLGASASGVSAPGRPVGVLDRTFGHANHLPASGTVQISGGAEVTYVGQGQSPESFVLPGDQPGLITQTGFAALFTSLPTAQRLAGLPGRVNDVVLTVRPGTDVDTVRVELSGALAATFPDVSTTVTDRGELASYRLLYDAIDSDQRLWDVLAVLVLAGAVFAAFNLVGRAVDAQRREIGIAMALGVRPGLLALRPLLLGVQVAVLGVVAGIGVGLLVAAAMGSLMRDIGPLPYWHTDFQASIFARAAVIGLVLPLLAAVGPVLRVVRSEPVEAIRVTAVAARSSSLVRAARRLPSPGGSIRRMPVRNLARTPRRTLLTALGIAAAITALVVFTGQLDTFTGTTDRAEAELTTGARDRLRVTLPAVEPVDGPTVAAVRRLPAVAEVDTGLALPGQLLPAGAGAAPGAGDGVNVITYVFAYHDAMWTPRVTKGAATGGLLIAQKAAEDLGVEPGDTLTLRHPTRVGGGLRSVDTPVRVAGIHAFPVRSVVFLDSGSAGAFNLAGETNSLMVRPAPGYDETAATRAILTVPGAGAVVPATASIEEIRSLLRNFVGILRIAELVVLLLALLIAYNAMTIAMEERRREHATMLAFGLPARTVLGLTVAESALIGLLGTLLGLLAGYWALRYTVEVLVAETLPDLGIPATLSARTVATSLLLGVLTVAAAPLLAARRVRRMDVPAALRVVD